MEEGKVKKVKDEDERGGQSKRKEEGVSTLCQRLFTLTVLRISRVP